VERETQTKSESEGEGECAFRRVGGGVGGWGGFFSEEPLFSLCTEAKAEEINHVNRAVF